MAFVPLLKLFSCSVTSCSTAAFILNILYSPCSPHQERSSLIFPTTNTFKILFIPGLRTKINPALMSVLTHPASVHDPPKRQSTTPPLCYHPLTLMMALIWLKKAQNMSTGGGGGQADP